MFVKDYMTKHPVLTEPNMHVYEVQNITAQTGALFLPVVREGKRLVGLITPENLRIPPDRLASMDVWEITQYLTKLRIKDVMIKRKDVLTVGPNAALEEAAKFLFTSDVDCLPVVEEDIVVGLLTKDDILAEFIEVMGGGIPGLRVTLEISNISGVFLKIMRAIDARNWEIYTFTSASFPKRPECWYLIMKIRNTTEKELLEALKPIEGYKLVDIREIDPAKNENPDILKP